MRNFNPEELFYNSVVNHGKSRLLNGLARVWMNYLFKIKASTSWDKKWRDF
jgi:hypothetical protein